MVTSFSTKEPIIYKRTVPSVHGTGINNSHMQKNEAGPLYHSTQESTQKKIKRFVCEI